MDHAERGEDEIRTLAVELPEQLDQRCGVLSFGLGRSRLRPEGRAFPPGLDVEDVGCPAELHQPGRRLGAGDRHQVVVVASVRVLGALLQHFPIGVERVLAQARYAVGMAFSAQGHHERIGLHRVGLSVFEFNVRAVRSYEKAGFTIEGRHREAIVRDGERHDELTMGILATEWRARHSDEG